MRLPFFLLVFSLAAALAAGEGDRVVVVPDNPKPGEPVTVFFLPEHDGETSFLAALEVSGRRLSKAAFFDYRPGGGRPVKAAIFAVPSTARPGPAAVKIVTPAETIAAERTITIAPRDFANEVIVLNETLTSIRADPDPRKTAEANHIWAILNRTGGDIYSEELFKPPVASTRRTSFFGDRRTFRYSTGKEDVSIHAGIDYGVPKGTEVRACASGKVVLARNRVVTGNSVAIEHLPGVYSLYYHLDSITVTEGALAAGGDILGYSGATGLATGPHLHWEIRVSGENTDPDVFISRPVLDKNALKTIMDLFNNPVGY